VRRKLGQCSHQFSVDSNAARKPFPDLLLTGFSLLGWIHMPPVKPTMEKRGPVKSNSGCFVVPSSLAFYTLYVLGARWRATYRAAHLQKCWLEARKARSINHRKALECTI